VPRGFSFEGTLNDMTLAIEKMDAPTSEVRALIAALEEELSPNYAPHQRHGLALEAIFQPHIHFFLARRSGEALGCAGVALYPNFAEVKRMYVRPEARGQGIADALMDRLAEAARGAGLTILRLETGDRQQAAIRFYARSGFGDCGDFEPYSSMPAENIATSIFMEKRLG
jgi:putative acetyltransferase